MPLTFASETAETGKCLGKVPCVKSVPLRALPKTDLQHATSTSFCAARALADCRASKRSSAYLLSSSRPAQPALMVAMALSSGAPVSFGEMRCASLKGLAKEHSTRPTQIIISLYDRMYTRCAILH